MDAAILADIANLGLEEKGMIYNAEKAASHLLVHDPFAKHKSASDNGNGDNLDHASDAEARVSSAASGKVSKCKTGLEIRYYKQAEFNKLSK